jgi:hypothetical protein
LGIAACGGAQSATSAGNTPTSTPAIQAITIKAVDFSFEQPQSIPAGLVDLTFVNNGAQPHMIQIARINNGNFNEFQAALNKQGPDASLVRGTFIGGANTIDPGQKQETIFNLQQGVYASICFVMGPDHLFHYMKGMITQLTVTPSTGTQAQAPNDNGVIYLKDYSFQLPSSIPSGPVTLKVTNQGPQTHEVAIVKMAQGKELADVLKFLNESNPSGPPPFTDAGGMGALQKGSSGWLKLNLQPGNYATLCFVPDIKTGKPHFMLGMTATFTTS